MEDIRVNGTSIGVNPSVYESLGLGSIVDTGTNIFLLPSIGIFKQTLKIQKR